MLATICGEGGADVASYVVDFERRVGIDKRTMTQDLMEVLMASPRDEELTRSFVPVSLLEPASASPPSVVTPTTERRQMGGTRSRVDDDLPLMRSLQSNDDTAMDAVIERFKLPLYGFIGRMIPIESEAADVLEETFVRIYLNRNRFRPKAKVQTWVFTIARNLCIDWVRKRRRWCRISEETIGGREPWDRPEMVEERKQTSPASAACLADELARLRQAIDRLPIRLKEALVLYVLEERTQDEVASIVHCSRKAVETRVYRAKRELARILNRS